jgi:hypothetical protein
MDTAKQTVENGESVVHEEQIAPIPLARKLEILQGHIDRAERGDVASLPQVQRLLDARPEVAERFGDLSQRVQAKWLRLISKEDLVMRDCVMRKLSDLREKLTVESRTNVDPIMIEEVLTSWLRKYYFEIKLCENTNESLALQRHRLREFSTMQHLYERSLSSLVLVRKLIPKNDREQVSVKPVHLPVAEVGVVSPVASVPGAKVDSSKSLVHETMSTNVQNNQHEPAFVPRTSTRKIGLTNS